MRQAIEAMVAMIFIVLLCLTGIDLMNVHMQAGHAKEFRNQVATAIVNSDYDEKVMKECLKKAEENNYTLKLELFKQDGSHFQYKGKGIDDAIEMMRVYVSYESKVPVLHTGWKQTITATT